MAKNLMRGEKNLPHMPEWKIRNLQENLPSFGYVGGDEMKKGLYAFRHLESPNYQRPKQRSQMKQIGFKKASLPKQADR